MSEPRILVIPDLHAPFHCEKGLSQIIKFAKHNKPTHVVYVGESAEGYGDIFLGEDNWLCTDTPFNELVAALDESGPEE